LAKVCDRNPSDDEAAIFHALQLVAIGYLDPTDKRMHGRRRQRDFKPDAVTPSQTILAWRTIVHSQRRLPAASRSRALRRASAYASIALMRRTHCTCPSHIFTRLGRGRFHSLEHRLDEVGHRTGAASARGGGAFDQLHAMDYLVYAYLQQAKDKSRSKGVGGDGRHHRLDENQFAAAYAFAASPARWALERHDWRAAAR